MKALASALLALLSLAPPLLAFDEMIRIEPARPTSTERIRVTVSGTWVSGCTPAFDHFDQGDGLGALLFSTPPLPCPAIAPPWSHTAEVGPLPSGSWKLQAIVDGTVVASTSFTVAQSEQRFAIVPSSARIEGGIPVVLRPGFGWCSLSLPCEMKQRILFGGVEATVTGYGGGRETVVIVPPHAPGRVDVTIYPVTGGGPITRENAFTYYDAAEGPPAESFERVLVPLMFEGDGALGSRWTSELTVHNSGETGIDPWNSIVRCGVGERCHPQIPPGATLHLTPSTVGSWPHGYLFVVPREQADDLDFSLHIRDLSRQAESFGTEVPVVRERDLPRSPIVLLDVPLNPRFRSMLRVYDVNAIDGAPIRIRYRLDDGSQAGGESRHILTTLIRCVTTPCWFPEPAAIALPLFDAALPPNITQDHLHVEIEPLDPRSRLWALVTVTNNETQQVTTITP
jgi:hypothetical protein